MNHQQQNHGFWPTPLFTPGLKQAQHFMSGMTGFGPSASWEKQFQFTKQRQAQMMLMGQQRNLRITQASPLDMDMPISPTSPIRMTSPRKTGKADRRAEHNAIERARRESLNVKFQQLAHALPNLQDDRRPSKSRIVEKALEWVRQTFHREQQYRLEMQQLCLENERLRAQLANKAALKGSSAMAAVTEIEVSPPQHPDTSMLSFSNWSGMSAEYLFDTSIRHDDQQDEDDNSSNDDYGSERTTSFYDDFAYSTAMIPQEIKKGTIIPSELNTAFSTQ